MASPSSLDNDPGQINILVVDDADTILKLVRRSIEPEGYTVHLAADGIEALEHMKTVPMDVVVTDINMPNMDGFELTRKVVASFSSDVIVMTGMMEKYRYDQFVGAGAADFVQKPFTPDEMVLRIKRVLNERSSRDKILVLNDRLRHSQKLEALGQISTGILHEINTPLQFIQDNTQFLGNAFELMNGIFDPLLAGMNGGADTAETRLVSRYLPEKKDLEELQYVHNECPDAIGQILEGVNRIREICLSMKTFVHPDTIKLKPFSVNQCIHDALIIARNEYKNTAHLELDLADDLPDIPCNPGELTQVFLNLVVNAAHAVQEQKAAGDPGPGIIAIHSQKTDEGVVVHIQDNGIGISENHLTRIFDPFYTTKPSGVGTGQGLAISRSIIVDRHKGNIEVKSEPGKGAEFIIRFNTGTDPEE